MKEGNKKQISIKIYLFWTVQQHVCVHVCNPSLQIKALPYFANNIVAKEEPEILVVKKRHCNSPRFKKHTE